MVEGGRAQLRSVRLGLHTLGAVEVLEGLAEGEQVLVRSGGADGALKPGQRVRVQRVVPVFTRANGGAAADAGSALTNAMGR